MSRERFAFIGVKGCGGILSGNWKEHIKIFITLCENENLKLLRKQKIAESYLSFFTCAMSRFTLARLLFVNANLTFNVVWDWRERVVEKKRHRMFSDTLRFCGTDHNRRNQFELRRICWQFRWSKIKFTWLAVFFLKFVVKNVNINFTVAVLLTSLFEISWCFEKHRKRAVVVNLI